MPDTNGLVDFHCHLDLYPDHVAAVKEAERSGVYTLAVTTTPKAWERNNNLARGTRHVRAALGLHPQLVAERSHELSLWESYLPETRYVGEVGLDAGPRYYASFELQKKVFSHILRSCAKAGNKVLSVHSIRSAKTVLDHIEAFMPGDRGRIVLHWFTGSKSELKRAVDLGCYFSVNQSMLLNDRGVDLVRAIPTDRLLTETDGPFVKHGDRSMRPSDVRMTVEAIAKQRNLDPTNLAAHIRTNLKCLIESRA